MKVIITGAAGFIGCNLAVHLDDKGYKIVAIDNMSKPGSQDNAKWLYNHGIEVLNRDVRHLTAREVDGDILIHLAANVDANRALKNPIWDFMNNGMAIMRLLDMAIVSHIPIIYASTCKVYSTKYINSRVVGTEIKEDAPVDPQFEIKGPYGCSKYVGDLYCQEIGALYEIPIVINRLSSIYGPRQFGNSGYGWVGHFIDSAKAGQEITIFGDGTQIRDILHIEDLCCLFADQIEYLHDYTGNVFNVGGSTKNAVSLEQVLSMLGHLSGRTIKIKYTKERPGDLKSYISNINKVYRAGHGRWLPKISVEKGIRKLWEEKK